MQISLERSVANAAKVLAEGAPELVKAVECGEVKVSAAAVVTDLPRAEQRKVVAGGKKAVAKAAKRIKAKKAKAKPAVTTDAEPTADETTDKQASLDEFMKEWARSRCSRYSRRHPTRCN